MADVKIRLMSPEDLIPYENNPRHNDEAVEAVMQSIRDFGFKNPVIVDKKNVIIAGHTRIKAAIRLGLEKVPVIRADDLTEEQAKAYRLVDNKTGELATWDLDLLNIELADIAWDMAPYGFELADMSFDLDPSELIDVEPEEVPEDPETNLGDMYRLGRHVLLCGDSTKEEDVNRLLCGKKADMVFTDPPWNVNYGGSDNPKYKKRKIINDDMGTEDFKEFMYQTFDVMKSACKTGAMVYVVMSAQEWGNMMLALKDNGFHWSSTIIWNKNSLVLSRKDYHTKYEPIWYGWEDSGPRICPLEDRTQSDVWDIDRPIKSEDHPTMKPVELVGKALTNSSMGGGLDSRSIRRIRNHTDCRRTTRTQMRHDGNGPGILRCYHKEMGEADGIAGREDR